MTNKITALILAAGMGTRFTASAKLAAPLGNIDKMTAPWQGQPMVRHVARQALTSKAREVIVVTGHHHAKVEAALAGLNVSITHNSEFAKGMASSLQAGLSALPADSAGALILLGDMPLIPPTVLDLLIAQTAIAPDNTLAIVPTCKGEWGHPVLLLKKAFSGLMALQGDQGARKYLQQHRADIVELAVDDAAILADIDTLADLKAQHPQNL